MRLSVITPSYNQGRYIERTICSVLDQGWPVEYWVIDGGSTDETVDILKRYEGQLHWVSEGDRGQGDALNKGFERTSGEIIGWLNSDDTYLPGCFDAVLPLFEQRPDINFISGECHVIDEGDRILRTWRNGPFNLRSLIRRGYSYIIQPTVFFRRELLDHAQGCDISYRHAMDYDLWCRMGRYVRPLYLNRPLATWRFHRDSKTCSQRRDALAEGKRIRQRYLTTSWDLPWCWYYDFRVWLYLKLEPYLLRWRPDEAESDAGSPSTDAR